MSTQMLSKPFMVMDYCITHLKILDDTPFFQKLLQIVCSQALSLEDMNKKNSNEIKHLVFKLVKKVFVSQTSLVD